MLRSKIYNATVTGKNLECEGSITIDAKLLRAADMLPNELVHVLNLNNGSRFETYIIEGKPGGGEIFLNGPAARLGEVGDRVIIITYGLVGDDEALMHRPTIVHVGARNELLAR